MDKQNNPNNPKQNRPQDKNVKYIVRIANTDVDGNKPILHALRKIKGVSYMFANMVCKVAGVDMRKKAGVLTDEEVNKLDRVVSNPEGFDVPVWLFNRRKDVETGEDKHILTSDLDFTQDTDVKMMKKIKSYRGMRHAFGLPVRGQKTKSNFRRNKGKGSLGVKRRAGAKTGK